VNPLFEFAAAAAAAAVLAMVLAAGAVPMIVAPSNPPISPDCCCRLLLPAVEGSGGGDILGKGDPVHFSIYSVAFFLVISYDSYRIVYFFSPNMISIPAGIGMPPPVWIQEDNKDSRTGGFWRIGC